MGWFLLGWLVVSILFGLAWARFKVRTSPPRHP